MAGAALTAGFFAVPVAADDAPAQAPMSLHDESAAPLLQGFDEHTPLTWSLHKHGAEDCVQPPPVLELRAIEGTDDQIEVVVVSAIDIPTAIVTVDGVAGIRREGDAVLGRYLQLADNQLRTELRRGLAPIQLIGTTAKTEDGRHAVVHARIELLNEQGELWMTIDKELDLNPAPQVDVDPAQQKVAVVMEGANGRRLVRHMPRAEAEALVARTIAAESPAPARIVEPEIAASEIVDDRNEEVVR